MVKRMLVDATHPEETRVVVVNGTKLEEFDFETSTKKQLKGNIYLAKVIRIEPSLQAAFVEYGGNRHGFLAFSEIHPDYYQIPVADREAILADQERRARQAEESEGQERPQRRRGRSDRGRARPSPRQDSDSNGRDPAPVLAEGDATDVLAVPDQDDTGNDQPVVETWDHEAAQNGQAHDSRYSDDGDENSESERVETNAARGDYRDSPETWDESANQDAFEGPDQAGADADNAQAPDADRTAYATERQEWPATYQTEPNALNGDVVESSLFSAMESQQPDRQAAGHSNEDPDQTRESGDVSAPAGDDESSTAESAVEAGESTPASVETLGGDDIDEEERPRRLPPLRSYKIQEVIKRRQILLVQVVKEERGNKGAALTTYLSLAGRYCVLMPNAGRGGGISRKITNAADRKRMREMLSEFEVPQGMGVILRTAGLERSKPEIRRDYDYLVRLWDNIRDVTLRSSAPALIYEEGTLIKRAIRDLYGKDIEDLLIEGEDGYRHAKEFMRQLMPSHAKKVQLYREPTPLFHRYQVETQLDAMHSPVVQLKTGAYIVINPTEALVAIDVNSGRATKERNIEETALRTNLEAAEEIARQLRLRDLAGLIVIDFIDMEDQRHQQQVERRLKDAMRIDRARIQIGRISAFGLLELSRQRLRPSLLENSTEVCPHCEGTGRIRSTESTALHVLRAIEEEGIRRRAAEIRVVVPTHVALYLLNQKRSGLAEIEQRYGFRVLIDGDDRLIPPNFTIERSRNRPVDSLPAFNAPATAAYDDTDATDDAEFVEDTDVAEETADQSTTETVPTEDADGENGGRRRRRRRRRRRDDENEDAAPGTGPEDTVVGAVDDGQSPDSDRIVAPEGMPSGGEEDSPDDSDDGEGATMSPEQGDDSDENQPKRRRRGRRGGRRRRHTDKPENDQAADGQDHSVAISESGEESGGAPAPIGAIDDEAGVGIATIAGITPSPAADADDVNGVERPVADLRPEIRHPDVPVGQLAEGDASHARDAGNPEVAGNPDEDASAPVPLPEAEGPPRRGWWQRLTNGR